MAQSETKAAFSPSSLYIVAAIIGLLMVFVRNLLPPGLGSWANILLDIALVADIAVLAVQAKRFSDRAPQRASLVGLVSGVIVALGALIVPPAIDPAAMRAALMRAYPAMPAATVNAQVQFVTSFGMRLAGALVEVLASWLVALLIGWIATLFVRRPKDVKSA